MKVSIFFCLIVMVIAAGCKSEENSDPYQVSMSGMTFSPQTLNVTVGSTVTWVNKEAVIHTVTSNDGLFDSGDMGKNSTFKYKFETVGTYSYRCIYHSGMTGTIVVKAATSGTSGTGYGTNY